MTARSYSALSFALIFAPSLAFASTTTNVISQLAGLLYIIAGLTLTISILLMIVGTVLWIIRFGTDLTFRDQAIRLMEWAVATLFTLILVLGVAEFVQTHTSATLYILSTAIILLLAWFFITSGIFAGGEKKEQEE